MSDKAEITATWDISLNCHCPKCNDYVNLIDADDFWVNHEWLKPIEHDTKSSNNIEVNCPECGHRFNVCCNY